MLPRTATGACVSIFTRDTVVKGGVRYYVIGMFEWQITRCLLVSNYMLFVSRLFIYVHQCLSLLEILHSRRWKAAPGFVHSLEVAFKNLWINRPNLSESACFCLRSRGCTNKVCVYLTLFNSAWFWNHRNISIMPYLQDAGHNFCMCAIGVNEHFKAGFNMKWDVLEE